jgi:GNAT superfamily N-acetyltransferase
MPLIVRPQEEADIEDSLRVQYAAFQSGPSGRLLSPAPEPSAEFIQGSKKDRLETMRSNKAARFMIVEDTDAHSIIAAAHWDIHTEERTSEQVEKLCHKSNPPPAANAAFWNDFFGHFAQSRRTLGNRPIAILHTLVTSPAHQGRGAGKLLMQRFIQEVDDAGVEAYLEASGVGRPLYAKFGFQPEFERHFELAQYGGEDAVEVNTVMLRPAKADKASA